MALIQQSNTLAELYTALKHPSVFSVVDVGCSHGINPAFKMLGHKLKALGIDASVDEVERLRKEDDVPGLLYIDGLIGLPEGHPFTDEMKERPYTHNSPWDRFSAARTALNRQRREQSQKHMDKMMNNHWFETKNLYS
jgi:hypothetical protein